MRSVAFFTAGTFFMEGIRFILYEAIYDKNFLTVTAGLASECLSSFPIYILINRFCSLVCGSNSAKAEVLQIDYSLSIFFCPIYFGNGGPNQVHQLPQQLKLLLSRYL